MGGSLWAGETRTERKVKRIKSVGAKAKKKLNERRAGCKRRGTKGIEKKARGDKKGQGGNGRRKKRQKGGDGEKRGILTRRERRAT